MPRFIDFGRIAQSIGQTISSVQQMSPTFVSPPPNATTFLDQQTGDLNLAGATYDEKHPDLFIMGVSKWGSLTKKVGP